MRERRGDEPSTSRRLSVILLLIELKSRLERKKSNE
jgi:hypothetical protein